MPGALVGERYRLVRVLGAGGMGAVHEAEAVATGERVAVKVLTSTGDWIGDEERARFLREAALAAKVKHENVVPVIDHGIDEDTRTPFLVMPLLHGEDLGATIARLGPLDPPAALRLFLQACRGLGAAHAAGVIHRDIKPSNLFVEELEGGALVLRVCDFGLAKTFGAGESLTRSGSFLGTPHYVSPEQARDAKRVDERSDVWSLAMSMYHALAGVPAFGHIDSAVQLIFELTAGNVRPLQTVAPWVEGSIARVIHGALLRDRDARCPSVAELERAVAVLVDVDATTLSHISTNALRGATAAERARVAPKAALPHSWAEIAPGDATTEEADVPILSGMTLGGRYTLGRPIGRGGMGVIYEATSPTGAQVALKVMHPERMQKSRDAMRRFVREARAAQAIESDHVAKVLEAGTDEGRGIPFIAMELLSGKDLGRIVRDRGALEPRSILPVFLQACRGLAAAHALGVVHRDIKPANIFLHEHQDGTITTKLCDFGIAKQIEAEGEGDATTDLTRTGGMLGSPIYMSPEQAQNAKTVDPRSDLFSLAITLHEALSGRRPWQGCTTMGELILAICTKDVAPLREVAPWVDPGLAQVVHRALARDPKERFPSAEELRKALAPYASKEPLTIESLASVPQEQRALASQPSALAVSLEGHASTARRPSAGPRPKRTWVVALVSALVIAGGAGAVAIGMRSGTSQATPPPATTEARTPVEGARVTARVQVVPGDATVTVHGVPRTLDADGSLHLEGQPGETFDVVLARGDARRTFVVALTSDGRAVPSSLELPAPAVTAAPPPPSATTPAPRIGGYGGAISRGGAANNVATSTPSSAASAAPAASHPAPKDPDPGSYQ